MYKEIFKKIMNASESDSLTFFVGAGISKLSDAPKWSELIDAFCNELNIQKKKSYSNEDYLSIPQMFYYSLGEDTQKYYNFVDGCFGKSLSTNTIHKKLFDLNPHSFVTTNFDDLLEKSAVENCQTFKSVACDNEIPQINGDKFILKLHGDLKHRNIILKEEDYLNYSENFKLTETLLKSIFATNTVVFIGYGLNDYNIKLILNWTKSLLKDAFAKPIFIYTDDAELSDVELKYHESKGLYVVDFKKLSNSPTKDLSYLERYAIVLDSIKQVSDLSLVGITKYDAFEILYSKLHPLNRLSALRIDDIKKTLEYKIIIEERGVINLSFGNNILMEHYLEILNMANEKRVKLPEEIIQKFIVVSNVFLKARITHILYKEHKCIEIEGIKPDFADKNCINFNYCAMVEYVAKEYSTDYENYRKAFYLAKLNKFKEAYNLFVDVAISSYKKEDYILHYLAQSNRKNVLSSIKSANNNLLCYDKYDIESLNGGKTNDVLMNSLFENLPLETQKQYVCLENLSSVASLYKMSYDSFVDGKKLENAIESNTLEMGMTSGEKVFFRINDYLHFLLSNSLYLDDFIEFKNTIKNSMSLLLYKYSVQEKEKLDKGWFKELSENRICFDEIDFYCFISYFESKEIDRTFSKYNIKIIKFNNTDLIEENILNIIKYYCYLETNNADFTEIIICQNKIKTCLKVLRYMDVSQNLIDYICEFIFKYEFRKIDIGDKVLFLDSQIYKRKMSSSITEKIIEDKLIYYIDEHLKALKKGDNFELMSHISGINYPNLVHYIHPCDDSFASKRLSIRVSRIINGDYLQLKSAIISHYYDYISNYQKNKFEKWLKEVFDNDFNFKDFMFLTNKEKLDKKSITALKKHLKTLVKKNSEKGDIKYQTIPLHEPYEDFQEVGYFCFIGYLPKIQFKCFLGYDLKFDFFYKYQKFDFKKFDVAWLLNWTNHVLKDISANKTVKDNIRYLISKELISNDLNETEKKKLSIILAEYFC